ncbi:hypothetical protein ElyMa_003672600 [Elysia marginata]|uniref:Uncharacterized protein n=1 Tax=Elysia marginata TaxID=1093978 RepID=A0AAV4EZ62_9GAST|nr:hypothetical protein ElyMa_003672600 [Elysia marginata]
MSCEDARMLDSGENIQSRSPVQHQTKPRDGPDGRANKREITLVDRPDVASASPFLFHSTTASLADQQALAVVRRLGQGTLAKPPSLGHLPATCSVHVLVSASFLTKEFSDEEY